MHHWSLHPRANLRNAGTIETCRGCGRPFYPFGPPFTEEQLESMKRITVMLSIAGFRNLTPREDEEMYRCGECMKIWDEGQRLEEARLAAGKVKQEKEGRILGTRIAFGMVALFYLWQFLKRN